MNKSKLVIFGIDGASWNMLDKVIAKGVMPNLKMLIKKHAKGTLVSSTPPATFPAWIDFLTGVNPGRHGVSGLVKPGKKMGQIIPLSGIDKKTTDFPNKLDKAGISGIYVNLPGLFPLNLKRGRALASFLWPGKINYYPADLVEDLPGLLEYKVFPDFLSSSLGVKNLIKEYLKIERTRFELAIKLFEKRNWQVFFYMVSAYDWVFHKIKDKTLDEALAQPNIKEFFEELDKQLGWFVKGSVAANFILLSDHGEKKYYWKFYINKWLIDHNYLRLKHVWYKNIRDLPMQIKIFNTQILESNSPFAWLVKLFQRYPILYAIMGAMVRRMHVYLPKIFFNIGVGGWGKEIIHNKRKAYYYGGIKFKGKYEDKIILADKLRDLCIPDTNLKVFSAVHLREEIYSGRNIKTCSDIILVYGNCICDSALWTPQVFLRSTSYDHSRHGIIVMFGPQIKRVIRKAKIVDIAPTVLKLFKLKFPQKIDGKSLI